MVSRFKMKQGATFDPSISVLQTEGGPVQPLTGWGIASQVRTPYDELVAPLVVVDRNDAAGTYGLRVASGTAAWPVGLLEWDIVYTLPGGGVQPIDTITFEVVKRVTK